MKNIKRNKIVLGSVIGLGVVALATVGFSSWIINISNEGSVGQINVAVADVVDKTVTISDAKLDTNNGTFNFGPTTTGTIIKLTETNTSEEDMTFAITYKVATENPDKLTSINAKLSVADGASSVGSANAFNEAIGTKNFIVSPLSSNDVAITKGVAALDPTVEGIVTTVTGTTSPYTFTTTFTFKWGAAFSDKNPADYVTEASQLSTVKTALQALRNANGAILKITLSSIVA